MGNFTLKELPSVLKAAEMKWLDRVFKADEVKRQKGHKNAQGVPLVPGDEVLVRVKDQRLVTARILEWRYEADWRGWGEYYLAFFLDDLQQYYVKATSIVWWPGKPGKKPTAAKGSG